MAAAADDLTNQGHAPSILIGHSLGGTEIIAAEQGPSARAVVTIALPLPGPRPFSLRRQLDQVEQPARRESRSGAARSRSVATSLKPHEARIRPCAWRTLVARCWLRTQRATAS
ncbi:hypothetical protein FPZ54_13555 [Sphingomonas suaedae]|uniref:Uncharacterized protein n=1 Tax=Sphingomonas suaedae TaxID=2599297 RepID=A0A518RLE4_9SPHN|nr:hypothetical protein FPZ54_13555 [Sphingomonas suaedae]